MSRVLLIENAYPTTTYIDFRQFSCLNNYIDTYFEGHNNISNIDRIFIHWILLKRKLVSIGKVLL